MLRHGRAVTTQPEDSKNVIHVEFGPGGGRKIDDPIDDEGTGFDDVGPSDPVADLYSLAEVARLFELSHGRLRYWDRSDFISPSASIGAKSAYSFQDLIRIRAAKELLDGGVPLQRVRRALEALRKTLPGVASPLSELRVYAEGGELMVRGEEGAFAPESGQLQIDFRVQSLTEDVVRVLRSSGAEIDSRQSAYEYYLTGCRLDEDPSTWEQAEDAYRLAIEADPSLGNAFTNLGNIRYRKGEFVEAEKLYREALRVDPEQPEAHYNLGFLAFERGEHPQAVASFELALHHDPSFADAHFNLAMALEEAGLGDAAREHWEAYLEIEPSGTWAEVARRHLRLRY